MLFRHPGAFQYNRLEYETNLELWEPREEAFDRLQVNNVTCFCTRAEVLASLYARARMLQPAAPMAVLIVVIRLTA